MLFPVNPREWKLGHKKGKLSSIQIQNKACNYLSTGESGKVIKYQEHFQRKQKRSGSEK